MSDADEAGVEERDIPNRVRSLHWVIEEAIEQAEGSSYRQRFTSTDVQERADTDLPNRTLRRALHDAVALGWIEQKRQQWKPGERAEEHAPEEEPTPKSEIGRANPSDKWHLMQSHNETMCGAELNYYDLDSDGEREQWTGFSTPDIHVEDLCRDCLGLP